MSRTPCLCLAPLALALACSAGGGDPSLVVGTEAAGGSSGGGFGGDPTIELNDAGVSKALSVHIESPPGIKVEFVTLGCSNACADLEAVATGGFVPYTFAWEDGSTGPTRHVCPTSTTRYQVSVTDAGSASSEFTKAPETVTAKVTADVIACPDGGHLDGGTGGRVDAGHSGPATDISVPGTADIWLAGQPDGSTLPCQCYGTSGMDVAPTNSPVAVPVVAGSTLTFAVTGNTSYTGGLCVGPTPDGGCIFGLPTAAGPANGLSSLAAPWNALTGVFLDANVPGGQPPAGLDVATSGNLPTLSPLLRQVFFIGDGLTGTGSGAVQRFVVPAGATRLFLASSDDFGNYNNSGQFDIVMSTL